MQPGRVRVALACIARLGAVPAAAQPTTLRIAVACGSPLRKRINEAVLAMYADGTYEEINRKWFAQTK